MDEGVAYMVMDEGAEATQPTQVVAIDNGDGTQQFAIPVIDPETGQETYMIIDPETAENINNGGTVVVNSEAVPDQVPAQGETGYAVIDNNQENMLVMKGEDSTGNIVVMLPNGEQGVMVSQEELGGIVQQPGETGAEADKVYVMEGLEMSNGSNMPAIVTSVNGFNPMQKPKYTESSSMIKIVGIQDKKPQQISVVKGVGTKTSYTTIQPDIKQQMRAPRKQSLATMAGYVQKEEKQSGVPAGLTGDLFKDTELVEAKVNDICRKVNMTEKEKEKLRLSLMTRGLNAGVGAGRGKPGRGRGSRPLSSAISRVTRRQPKKTIKCDMCKKEFPANVEESILIHHVKTAHMNKARQEKEKEKSAMTDTQPEDPSTQEPTTPTEAEPTTQTSTKEEDSTPDLENNSVKKEPAPVAKKQPAEVIKNLVNDWDEDEEKMEVDGEPKNGSEGKVPDSDGKTEKSIRQSVDKSEDIDEDQIVADVDDILKDTDNIMSDVDTMLSSKKKSSQEKPVSPSIDDEDGGVIKSLVDKKRPTVQCEECYECFEDAEKLAWHNLNDH